MDTDASGIIVATAAAGSWRGAIFRRSLKERL